MPHPTRDYLDHLVRVTADNVIVTLFRLNDDGTYQAREVASGAEYPVARPNNVTWYRLNERVEVSRPSATGNVKGAMPVILTPGPQEQRGLSGSTPNIQRESTSRASIISLDPDPLVLQLGGAAKEQIIFGVGLDSQPATYVNPVQGGTDPSLTDAVAQVATDTQVTVNMSADAGGVIGEFDVVINGARAPKALRITPAAPHTDYLWVYASDATKPLLYQISVDAAGSDVAQIIHTYNGPVTSPKMQFGGTAGYGNTLYWLMTNGSVSHLATINPETHAISTIALSFIAKSGSPLFLDTETAYGDQSPRLLCLGSIGASSGLIAFKLDGSGAAIVMSPISINFNGFSHLQAGALTAVGTLDSKRVEKPNLGGDTLATSATLKAANVIAVRSYASGQYGAATGIYVASGGAAGKLDRGTLSDLAITNTFTQAGETSALGFLVQMGSLIYAISTTGFLYSFDPASSVGVQMVDLGSFGAGLCIATNGVDALYVAEGSSAPSRVKKLDANGSVVVLGTFLTASTTAPRVMLYF